MSLVFWTPLIRDTSSQGLLSVTPTTLGTISFVDGGKIGKCLSAGTSSQTINGISYNTNLVNELGTNFSCSIWVKPLGNHVHYNGTFVSSGNWNNVCWSFGVSQDNTKVDILSKNYNRYIDCTVPVNKWTHLVCTSENGLVKLYKNGEYVGQSSQSASLGSDASNFCIGRETYASGYFSFNGNINDVRFYNHVLSQKEIKLLSQGLVVHYGLGDSYLEGTTNLVTSLTQGGRTTLIDGGKAVQTTGENSDTYFRINTPALVSGTTYTLSMYAKGISEGSYWKFRFNNNTSFPFFVYNGYNTYTFTADSSLNGVTNALIDDELRPDYANKAIFYDIQLEAKDHATGYAGMGGTRDDTTVYDSSGYNYHGSTLGTLTISNDTSRYNSSTVFDGSSSGILIENINLSAIINSEVTYSFWIKPNGENGARSIYFGSYSGVSWSIEKTTGNLLRSYWNGSPDEACVGATISDGVWQHICVTKKGTNEIKAYINGELKWTSTVTHSEKSFPTTYRIGRDTRSGDGTPYKGQMSDFRIYATTLSANDIKELYQVGASISKNKELFAYKLNEPYNGELMNVRYTSSHDMHNETSPYTKINSNGEYYFDSNMTSAGSIYIPVNPTNKVYYYDMMLSVNTGNQFYVGWERYDKNFTSRSNNACTYVYATKPTSDIVKQRYRGIVNLSTDGVNPCAYIALRILNGWSSTTSGVTGRATIHYLSLREVDNNVGFHTSFGKNGIVTTDLFLEPNDNGDIEKTGIINMSKFHEI